MIKNYLLSIVLACSIAFTMQGQTMETATYSLECSGSIQLKPSLSWTKLSSGTTKSLKQILFINKDIGFAIGDSGLILKTTNSGNSWIKKDTLHYDPSCLKSIFFVNKDTGYIVGTENIRKTTDGGETWKHISGLSGNSIWMTSANTGFVGTNNGLYNITDNGDTLNVGQISSTSITINSVYFSSPTNGYAVGANGMFYKTTNGGTSWAHKTCNVTNNLRAVYFTDANNGYITGESGIFLKTSNGGNSWTSKTFSDLTTGYSIYFTSQDTGYIVSSKGYRYKTTDKGENWVIKSIGLPDSTNLQSITFTDPKTGYIVTDRGAIYKFDGNGTYSWSSLLPTDNLYLSATNIENPIASPTQTITYKLTFTNRQNITTKYGIKVIVNQLSVNAGADQTTQCGGTAQLGVTANYSGGGTFKYKWTPSTGLSNDTIANPVASVTTNTTYTVTVSNSKGCTSSDQVQVNLTPISSPTLGIVTANSSNNNVIAWNRPSSTTIDSICVYKETNVTNVYKKIGSVAYSAPNQFVDSLSNTSVQSNKYRISLKDHCGFESAQSDPHKSMHLAINQGVNGSWNLIWEAYSGFTVSTYNIYRGTNAQNVALINSTSGSNTQFTDLTAPSGNVYYQIEVISPYSIFVDKQATAQSASLLKSATASTYPALYYSSRSNVATNNTAGIATTTSGDLLSIYPNPAKDNIRISTNSQNGDEAIINIYNTTGSLVKSDILGLPDQSYDISSLSNGIYILELKSGNITYKKRLIVNK
ncbi:YCF48-related protein [Parabacteroides sp. FAFU027]|uniref:YCF48-related protein n=1 Tax=Parabacteroides sp. FAFU027 TaxID=2922715 RepID=UPI001FAF28AF|nr:YCF48-related protein [Parabacteroides sp. FAFU027]